MNLAALWSLPVLFLCENNRYAMGTAIERYESETDLALKAASYEMTAWSADGMDVLAVEEAARRAAAEVRDGDRPCFLELRTYRFRAHSMYDPDLYRTKEEIERWKEHDPIPALTDAAPGRRPADRRGRRAARAGDRTGDRGRDRVRRGRDARAGRGPRAVRLLRGGRAMSVAPAKTITYREAMREAIREALLADERVFLMGEDVGAYGGCFGVSKGLLDEFGPERIRDTPLSESAFVGAGIGAAMGGMRPIVEVMTVNFCLLALDQIMNNAATITHMSGGQFAIPLVIRMTTGAGRQVAAQHSHSLEGWLAHIPGLKLLAPATLADARGMLAPALADPNPVLIFEHGSLYNLEGELPADAGAVDIERAAIRRPGSDVTLIAYGGTLPTALSAAEELATRRDRGRGDRPARAAPAR